MRGIFCRRFSYGAGNGKKDACGGHGEPPSSLRVFAAAYLWAVPQAVQNGVQIDLPFFFIHGEDRLIPFAEQDLAIAGRDSIVIRGRELMRIFLQCVQNPFKFIRHALRGGNADLR